MNQIIRFNGEDFKKRVRKEELIDLAMMEEYDGVFDYEFTVDCYREMMKHMIERINDLTFDLQACEDEITEYIDQEILEEMAEW